MIGRRPPVPVSNATKMEMNTPLKLGHRVAKNAQQMRTARVVQKYTLKKITGESQMSLPPCMSVVF